MRIKTSIGGLFSGKDTAAAVEEEVIHLKYFSEATFPEFCWHKRSKPIRCESHNGNFYEPSLMNNC